jgi:D-beta-D-heptose 7-phosphate kinase/D-beta-D-heptose 1-phosphate adenosyltransferase
MQYPKNNFLQKNYSDLVKIYKKEISKKKYSAIIFSDYKKGVLEQCKSLIAHTYKLGIPVFIDPKGSDFSIYENATLIKPNLTEFENIVGRCFSEKDFNEKAKILKNKFKIDNLLITKGCAGMTFFHKKTEPIVIPATNSRDVFDVTGAGDTVLATVVAAFTSNFSIIDSVKIANVAAGIVVSKFGTATVSREELKVAFENSTETLSSNFKTRKKSKSPNTTEKIIINKIITNQSEMDCLLDYIKSSKKKVIFTNGCFDILHAGHIHLFKESKKFGDLLIVAINSDKSVKTLKGKSRPINSFKNRVDVLKSIEYINFIIGFNEKTPENLIKLVKPMCLVKGGDYKNKTIVGSNFVKKNGGKVETIPLKNGLSTTNILKTFK